MGFQLGDQTVEFRLVSLEEAAHALLEGRIIPPPQGTFPQFLDRFRGKARQPFDDGPQGTSAGSKRPFDHASHQFRVEAFFGILHGHRVAVYFGGIEGV